MSYFICQWNENTEKEIKFCQGLRDEKKAKNKLIKYNNIKDFWIKLNIK